LEGRTIWAAPIGTYFGGAHHGVVNTDFRSAQFERGRSDKSCWRAGKVSEAPSKNHAHERTPRENIGALMLDSTQPSDGVITKSSSKSVAQTIDGLRRVIADRGFTVFNVIDHSGIAERAGVQMPESKLVMFGKPAVGAAVMVAAPLAALDVPLKVLVWEDGNGAVSMSYNSPGFLSGRHHLEGALRAPFDAVESIVDAVVGP
jgi:uncharacterized protein (DUF302 family)